AAALPAEGAVTLAQLDLLAAGASHTDAAQEVHRRLAAAGVWHPPDRVGDPAVATYRVRDVEGEPSVSFRFRRGDGRAPALTIAAHAVVGFARIELEPGGGL